MAWVRPKRPKRKVVEVDPTEALRPVLEYFSCRPSAPNPNNNKQLVRIPKKQLLLHDSYESRPQKHHEEPEHHQSPDHHHQSAEHHPRLEHQQRIDHHPRTDHITVDYDRASYHERASQRSASHYTRERASQRSASHYTREPSPPPPPLPSYRSSARPGAHLHLMPSRHHVVVDTYTPRRPTSRWESATTPLEM